MACDPQIAAEEPKENHFMKTQKAVPPGFPDKTAMT